MPVIGTRQSPIKLDSTDALQLADPGALFSIDFFPRHPDGNTPDLTNWFHYEGSLTSEPYSEDVSWFVMKNESPIDPADVDALKKYAEQEARPPYSLDRRLVVKSFA